MGKNKKNKKAGYSRKEEKQGIKALIIIGVSAIILMLLMFVWGTLI